MLVSKEVRALQEPITGKDLIESSRTFKERCIVAHTEAHSRAANSRPSSDRFDPPQKSIFSDCLELGREALCFLHGWR
jgi:hypothetical protein